MTIRMADQTRITSASQRVFRAQWYQVVQCTSSGLRCTANADDLDDDDDAGRDQGRGEDEGERPVEQAHRRFLPYRTRGGGVMSVARSATTMWTSSTSSPASSRDPVADVAADLPGDLGNGCGPADG